MTPDPSRTLAGMAAAVAQSLVPELPTLFAQHTAGVTSSLAFILAQEVDRLADRLRVENRAVTALLNGATALVPGDLAADIASATAAAPADIRVSSLQAHNSRLRFLLIRVHAAVEATPGPEAAAMNERIWAELREQTRRRDVIRPGR